VAGGGRLGGALLVTATRDTLVVTEGDDCVLAAEFIDETPPDSVLAVVVVPLDREAAPPEEVYYKCKNPLGQVR